MISNKPDADTAKVKPRMNLVSQNSEIGKNVENPVCECLCVHHEMIDKYSDQLITLDRANNLSELFKTLGDPTRIRIMDALAKSEFCVCDLAEILGLSQSATSHQLRVLRNNALVKYRREGKMVYYSVHDPHVLELYRQGLEHNDERA